MTILVDLSRHRTGRLIRAFYVFLFSSHILTNSNVVCSNLSINIPFSSSSFICTRMCVCVCVSTTVKMWQNIFPRKRNKLENDDGWKTGIDYCTLSSRTKLESTTREEFLVVKHRAFLDIFVVSSKTDKRNSIDRRRRMEHLSTYCHRRSLERNKQSDKASRHLSYQ